MEDKEKVLIRMPFELIEAVKQRADQHERTYNREIVQIIKEVLQQEQERGTSMTGLEQSLNGLSAYGIMKFLAQEKLIERNALSAIYGTGYTDCFRIHGIDPQIVEVDINGNPKETEIPKKDKKGEIIKNKNGEAAMTKQVEIILEGHTIPNKKNWEKFLKWAQEEPPVWFNSVENGQIVIMGTKNRLVEKMEDWEVNHRNGANKEKVSKIWHPTQKRLLTRYIEFSVDYWTLYNKLRQMEIEGWGFASEWACQEMKRIINFSKTEIPEMYKTVYKSLDKNLNSVNRQSVGIAVVKALNFIGVDLTDERIDILANEISKRLEMDGDSINTLAQSIIDSLSKQMHNLFLGEKRTVSPELIDAQEGQNLLEEKAS